ncbi:DgyrCDS7950 [Dimorphilus gyrociliatus]|uniref:Anoctamin n=1 Tax=Dimorphilus gyrociliatus TaxID=2664684 RepID=A0A7I8VUC8_9ANNE|nr:DgyrCDS7950 [Dimorphilus gyrociliatus]
MNQIPTKECDVLITFPKSAQEETVKWLLQCFRGRVPELIVRVRYHNNTKIWGLYFTTNNRSLLRGAEIHGLIKEVKVEFGGGKREFTVDEKEIFLHNDDIDRLLTSEERQCIVRSMIDNLRALKNETCGNIKFLQGQAIVPLLESKGIIQHVLPIHDSKDLSFLKNAWVKKFWKNQPLNKIAEYFGIKIGMYFAYLGHYTKALLLPTIIGIIIWAIAGKEQKIDDLLFVIFAFINVVWSTLYLEHWKRRSSEIAYEWGTLDKEDDLLVEPRPLYKGNLIQNPVTNRTERHYPAWKRNLFRYFVTVPVICISLGVVFGVMLLIFMVQDWINLKISKGFLPSFTKFLPKVALALSIGILDNAYKKIAVWLNNKENHRLDDEHENHLIIKLILFQFVNSFLSLFYIAFYLQDMNRLREQLAALLITRQVIGNIKEALLPYVKNRIKLFRIGYEMTSDISPNTLTKQATEIKEKIVSRVETEIRHRKPEKLENVKPESSVEYSGPTLSQAEIEASMEKYEDTFEDYLEMFIQFGYVVLFSSAFPLAALCAFLNNVIEIRSDAFKLCHTFQRPFGQRVQNIGTWQDALEVMSVTAVIINCALIGNSGLAHRLFPNFGTTEMIVLIVALEHIILACKFLLAYAIPDIPHWIAQEKARLEFLRRGAFKTLESKVQNQSSIDHGNSPVHNQDSPLENCDKYSKRYAEKDIQ